MIFTRVRGIPSLGPRPSLHSQKKTGAGGDLNNQYSAEFQRVDSDWLFGN